MVTFTRSMLLDARPDARPDPTGLDRPSAAGPETTRTSHRGKARLTSRDSSRGRPRAASGRKDFVRWAALGLLAGLVAGCGGSATGGAGGSGRLVADHRTADRATWADFDSAVSAALMRNQLAVIERENLSDTQRRWKLLSATDEPGWLTATIPEPGVRPWDDRVEFECSIGRFGAPERERAFIDSVRAWRPRHTR